MDNKRITTILQEKLPGIKLNKLIIKSFMINKDSTIV